MPGGAKAAKRRGIESKTDFRKRLVKEKRWDVYVKHRDRVVAEQGVTTAGAHNIIYDDYAPDDDPDVNPTGAGGSIEALFSDTLPNGCPLFDEKQWEGKATTNLLDDVRWVADHLGLKDFDYVNRSPSLRACTLYWEARYTVRGMTRYQDLLRQLEIPDKATLKDLNRKKDDGAELEALNTFLDNYIKHQKGQDDHDAGTD